MTAYDWEQIIIDEGDDALPPSLMHLLDTSLDMQGTFRKFWATLEGYYRSSEGIYDAKPAAYKAAGYCDTAVLNLIATHLGDKIEPYFIRNMFKESMTVRQTRLLTLMVLTTESNNRENLLVSSVNMVSNGDPKLMRKYPLTTDEGFKAQKALVLFTNSISGSENRLMRKKAFRGFAPDGVTAWYSDTELVKFVLDNPDHVERMIRIANERKSVDVGMLREAIMANHSALSSGAL